jgi:deazaflavin-dependent oxidoreductase (nitroreductase family)
MTEAKLAPNLPGWMADYANRYLSSGGTEGHSYKMTQPRRPEMTVPSLLLTTTGRESGERFIFPLFYGKAGDGYAVVASKGGAPEHPGWYRNILSNPELDVQVGTAKLQRRARTATGEERRGFARDPRSRAGSRPLTSTGTTQAARQRHRRPASQPEGTPPRRGCPHCS